MTMAFKLCTHDYSNHVGLSLKPMTTIPIGDFGKLYFRVMTPGRKSSNDSTFPEIMTTGKLSILSKICTRIIFWSPQILCYFPHFKKCYKTTSSLQLFLHLILSFPFSWSQWFSDIVSEAPQPLRSILGKLYASVLKHIGSDSLRMVRHYAPLSVMT